MKFVSLVFFLFMFLSCQAQLLNPNQSQDNKSLGAIRQLKFTREVILGNIIKNYLENMHFSKKKYNDELSAKSLEVLIERFDYSKRFFLLEDVEELRKHKWQLDDALVQGDLSIVNLAQKLFMTRLLIIEPFVLKTLSAAMTFSENDLIETDPKKISFAKDMAQLKDYWGKYLKYEVLNRYWMLKEDPLDKDKDKDKKKKKKELPMNDTQLLTKAKDEVKKSYEKYFARIKKDEYRERLDKFYNAVTAVYDPHTTYLIPEDQEDFKIRMSGKLEGIGAVLREDGSFIKVEKIMVGSASWKQKELQEDDIILKVAQASGEAISVVDMSIQDAVKLIRGPKGSIVKLTVKSPNGLIKVIAIKRDVVEIEDTYVRSTLLQYKKDGEKIGYINVPSFYRDFDNRSGRNCTDDTRLAIESLQKQGIKGLILDLRGNGGGALEDARLISGLFFSQGPVVQVKSSTGEVEVLADKDPRVQYEGNLIVMIDRFSASASEIVAGALQDYGRAIIVGGDHSHGKGTVQAVIELDNSSIFSSGDALDKNGEKISPLGAIKLTIQSFYRVNGISTQQIGVTPDIIFPDMYSYLESGEKYLDYSLPNTKVEPVSFSKWTGKYNVKKLADASKERVGKSARFKNIIDKVAWFTEQKNNTKKPLSFFEYLKENEKLKTLTEKHKKEEIIEDIVVTSTEKLDSNEKKERFKEFEEKLKKDPYLEETLMIFKDLN